MAIKWNTSFSKNSGDLWLKMVPKTIQDNYAEISLLKRSDLNAVLPTLIDKIKVQFLDGKLQKTYFTQK